MRRLLIIALLVSGLVWAQQPPTINPEQQDVINLLQRESAAAIDRARQAELMLAKTQREIQELQKKCTPKVEEKK